jgi:hypothetical protein
MEDASRSPRLAEWLVKQGVPFRVAHDRRVAELASRPASRSPPRSPSGWSAGRAVPRSRTSTSGPARPRRSRPPRLHQPRPGPRPRRDRSVETLRTRTHELLDAAYAQGVRYFDAARSYGRSEEFLADWLNAHPDRTTSWSAASGATPTPPTGAWTPRRTRSRTTASPDVRPPARRDRRTARRPPRPLPDPLGDPRQPGPHRQGTPRPAGRGGGEGVTVGFSTSGPAQADAIRAALAVTVDGEPLFRTVQSRTTPWRPPRAPRWPRRTTPGSP